MTFGQKLKALRKERGITQKELGLAIGKSNRVISYYENEEYEATIPDEEMIKDICKYFGVPEAYFTDYEKDHNVSTRRDTLLDMVIDLTAENSITWDNIKKMIDISEYTPESANVLNIAVSRYLYDNYEELYPTFKGLDFSKSYYAHKGTEFHFLSFNELKGPQMLIVGDYDYEEMEVELNEVAILFLYNEKKEEFNKLNSLITGDYKIYEEEISEKLINLINNSIIKTKKEQKNRKIY